MEYGEAHSPRDAVLEAAAAAKNAGADVIVTVGGGSLTDGAKVVRIALQAEATTSEELGKYCFKGDVSAVKDTKLIPQVSIPTTLSAGEFAPYAGCTDPATKVKETYVWLDALPKAIVLDPWLAQQTPEWLFLSTGLRAVDHCVECLLSMISTAEPVSLEPAFFSLGGVSVWTQNGCLPRHRAHPGPCLRSSAWLHLLRGVAGCPPMERGG